ncbi:MULTISPECIES: cytochrome d ubiquinol oxidase subunit II [Petrimonas]|jgi:cytochrome d ubiquinol oxidase subunit II|uniref:Cytochrome bd ubiquinol oxidase subunit 2 n=1 Tax=Petrimonas mucosa TaxID=1642646 RepID=A0A1G4G8D1_9BACT|nr:MULTISPECIES: cytochrome d ubiquinol oxidase subunit II [Petrimonas]MDD3561792.1 cytochrome d ubiquinol oxidase subunit II [Petrimonas mucosa]SCM58803.1 Cytochrome bd ubiquinol oxidase subunit 2 [Petrimonas mucosa]SFU69610.1 cytochrome bd-I ubiquinol oxidase subunit 2 apoprotein [Porphyromonadaceae bacterium KHP3R9]HHT28876.1 cytochrome d ubiquinol oxidase subunit II [Petrimonas mucosa]
MITYEFLQNYWWFIISLLGGLLVFLLFVQGGQSMIHSISKTEDEKKLVVNALGRKWEYTFTTLVTFGGAFFASFPLFYATSFGGAYWVWMLLLFSFVVQAVSYEFQSKPGNVFGPKTYRAFLFFNGIIGTFVLGVAVATFFTGSEFTINKVNLVSFGTPGNVMSGWDNPLHGLEALGNPRNWCLGLAVLFLARTMASLFFVNRLDHDVLHARSRKYTLYNGVPFVVFFLAFLIWTLVSEGYAVNPDTGEVFMEPYKYLNNFIQMPVVLVLFLLGVVAVLWGIIATVVKRSFNKGIWFAGAGTVVAVTMLLLVAGYNNTAYYPSYTSPQSSLTVQNSSSSEFTLTAMSIVSLLVPFVLAYIVYAWRALERKKLKLEDLGKDGHAY